MKSTEEIARPILNALDKWMREQSKLVVAIDGHIGAGKTTLLNYLAEQRDDVVAVPTDEFLLAIDERRKLVRAEDPINAMETGAYDFATLERVIEDFRQDKPSISFNAFDKVSGKPDSPRTYRLQKPILLMEGAQMFRPNRIDHLWDKRVYLESNAEAAADRREARDQKIFRKIGRTVPSRHDPNSLAFTFEKVLKKYRQEVKPTEKADLVVEVD